MKFSLSVFLILFCSHLFAQDSLVCPLGEKEDHLTIQRVMRNFGRYTRHPQFISLKGVQWPSDITDLDIEKAVADLDIVVACARAVVTKPEGDLLPTYFADLSAEERSLHMLKYLEWLRKFIIEVQLFQSMFRELSNVDFRIQDQFKKLEQQSKKMDQVVNEAHEYLGGG